jgi:flagellum-specific ATP synthase
MRQHADMPAAARGAIWAERLRAGCERAVHTVPFKVEGRLTRMVGLTLEAVGCQVPVGARCDILTAGGEQIEAEVVGFSGDR